MVNRKERRYDCVVQLHGSLRVNWRLQRKERKGWQRKGLRRGRCAVANVDTIKKKKIFAKPVVLASSRKRIDVCVCGKKRWRLKETAKGVASRAQPNFRGPKNCG